MEGSPAARGRGSAKAEQGQPPAQGAAAAAVKVSSELLASSVSRMPDGEGTGEVAPYSSRRRAAGHQGRRARGGRHAAGGRTRWACRRRLDAAAAALGRRGTRRQEEVGGKRTEEWIWGSSARLDWIWGQQGNPIFIAWGNLPRSATVQTSSWSE